MGNWPNWKELKKSAKVDPQRVEEVRRGIDQGRKSLAERLSGPAQHLRTVGSEFKAGLTQPEPVAEPAAESPTESPTVAPEEGTATPPPPAG
jgi:hypothetical protein